jgi:hypothetical protein
MVETVEDWPGDPVRYALADRRLGGSLQSKTSNGAFLFDSWKGRNFAVFEHLGMIDRLYAVAVSGLSRASPV